MSWQQIPEELKAIPQWVGATDDKRPIDPKTGKYADVTLRETWGTFEQACCCGAPNIGFVFSPDDPYCFIDLDTNKHPDKAQLHTQIVMEANSYTETSKSKGGSHIVVKAFLKHGVRDDDNGIEIYGQDRYMMATGWHYHGDMIAEAQDLVNYLVEKIGQKRHYEVALTTIESNIGDEDLYMKIGNSENGQKFIDLFAGDWHKYPEYKNDHSRADLALCTFLDFHTKDVSQVVRLFKYSKLYRPGEKGRRGGDGTDYIERTLKQARARNEADIPPPVDATELARRVLNALDGQKQIIQQTAQMAEPDKIELPPGLVGELAQYFYTSSIRPVPEIALMAAMGLMAGIVGRQYNISGSGLNLYLIILASTGTGKEGAGTAISSLMSRVRERVPSASEFLGPADYMSGPAVIKTLANTPCCVSVIGEIGLRLQQMADPRSNGAEKTLQRALLNLYSKSGYGQQENSSAYSDREKNTSTLYSPALSIFGDSQPETFFEALSEHHVMSGLLPRFSFMEYRGKRPPRNRISAFCAPQPQLVEKMENLTSTVMAMQANNSFMGVFIDQGAQALLDKFDEYADERINTGTELYKHLWNRAHLKALRVSGVLAVGMNWHQPIVDINIANWAIKFVKQDIDVIEARFRSNEVGQGEHRYEAEVRRTILRYLSMNADKRRAYNIPEAIIGEALVPYSYIRRCLRQVQSFKDDRRGSVIAIQATLKDMVDAGILELIPPLTKKERYGLTTDLYLVGQAW